MGKIYLLGDQRITGTFTNDGIIYPPNWCEVADDASREEVGIISLQEVFPDLEEGYIYSAEYDDDLSTLTRTYRAEAAIPMPE